MILHEPPVAGDKVCLDRQEPRLISSLEPISSSEEAASRGGPGTGGFSPDKSPHSCCVTQSDTESGSQGGSQSDSQSVTESPPVVEGR